MFLPDFAGQHKAGKYVPVERAARPADRAVMPIAETQTEPHTCGLHAARSLYAAYGLDPDAYRLRFRLGTDEPAVRADQTSAGTLHPDLYRVLAQDGFDVRPIDLDASSASEQIENHLQADQLAFAVVYRGTYHWVLLHRGQAAGEWVVIDSLREQPIAVSANDCLADALSVTLIRPADPSQTIDASDAHAMGVAEMARLYRRR